MTSEKSPSETPIWVHLVAGWPLVLVAIGGAIGGGLGGLAYAANMLVHRTAMPVPVKVLLNLVIGLAAIGMWLVIATLIAAGVERVR